MPPKFLNALAEPNRLRIVDLLKERPLSVNEVANDLGLTQPQTSKHLKYLSEAKVVSVNRLAQRRIYQLNPEPFLLLDAWLKSFERFWNLKLDDLETYLNNN